MGAISKKPLVVKHRTFTGACMLAPYVIVNPEVDARSSGPILVELTDGGVGSDRWFYRSLGQALFHQPKRFKLRRFRSLRSAQTFISTRFHHSWADCRVGKIVFSDDEMNVSVKVLD